MIHYTCPECRGVSETPKVCETPGCGNEGKQLAACTCEDGQHQQQTPPNEE